MSNPLFPMTRRLMLAKKGVVARTGMICGGMFGAYGFVKLTEGLVLCPMHRLTGLYCPGCGLTRGILRLLRGDFSGAITMYPPVMVIACVGAGAAFFWVTGIRPPPKLATASRMLLPYGAVGLALFGVLRNLEMFSFLQPS